MNYFDYAATTKEDKELIDIYKEISEKYYMNNINDTSSKELEDQIHMKINEVLNLQGKYEAIFTGTGTEANNIAILGKFKHAKGKHFITTKMEHPSVLETFKELEERGHEVTYITPAKNGIVVVDEVLKEVKKNTVLIGIMSVNNEIGTVQPIKEIFKGVKAINPDILTMTDAVQGLGKINIDMSDIDLITFSAHKIYGPKGIGLLVKRKDLKFDQIICGSKGYLRPGTKSLPLQACFLNVINKSILNLEENQKKVQEHQKYFLSKLDNVKCEINGHSEVGIVSLTLDVNALSETISKRMFDMGIVVSTRSACSQKSNSKSHVLRAIGLSDDQIDRTIRVSFSTKTTKDEIDKLVEALEAVCVEFSK